MATLFETIENELTDLRYLDIREMPGPWSEDPNSLVIDEFLANRVLPITFVGPNGVIVTSKPKPAERH